MTWNRASSDYCGGYAGLLFPELNSDHMILPPLPDLRQIKRILLVIGAGSIGDFILTLPALRILRLRFPEAYLEFMPQTSMLEITPGHWADRVSSPADHQGLDLLFEKNACLPGEIVEYFGGFDLIIWYGYDPDCVLAHNLRKMGCGGVLSADWSPAEAAGRHASDHVVAALRPLGVSAPPAFEPEIRVSRSTLREARQLLGELGASPGCAVHPGSSLAAKNWPPHRFAAFIQKITVQNGMQVFLIEGPLDRVSVQNVSSRITGLDVPILQLPLRLLAAVLAQCLLFVGNDSGVAHLAATVGTPTIAIFGPTDPLRWAPRGQRVIILKNGHGLDAIEVEDVVEAANDLLGVSGSEIVRSQEY